MTTRTDKRAGGETGGLADGSRKRSGATITDVARHAGVSTATVSRALNLPNLVSPGTLERVRGAVVETGYIPTLMAGNVITNRTRLVAVMIPPMPLQLFDTTLRSVVADLEKEGYQTLFGIYNREATREQIITQILSRRPTGLILIGLPIAPDIRDLIAETGLPIVETWEMPREPIDMVAGISHEQIGLAIGEFLIRKGYRRPVIFSTRGRGMIRRHGVARIFVDAGLPEPPYLDHDLPGTIGEGRRSLAEILDRGDRPDVIVCASDWLAQGAIIEAGKRGLRIPEDLAVIGFGDFDFARDLEPALTTIRIDGAAIGHCAASLILEALAGTRPRKPVVDVGFTLIERASA